MRKIQQTTPNSVEVRAHARLHLGFLDMHGGLGRRFASLGMPVEEISTTVVARPSRALQVTGKATKLSLNLARHFMKNSNLSAATTGVHLNISSHIPTHAGLGSGTQMALAIGTAIGKLGNLSRPASVIAHLLNRGKRSGIGIGAFTRGGFLLDAGNSDYSSVPPLLSRLVFPKRWVILLVLDKARHGLNGAVEQGAFNHLSPMPAKTAAHLCRLALMQILPAVAEANYSTFASAVCELQTIMGECFTPFQGGTYTSEEVAEVLHWAKTQGGSAVGQSSWGPTGFAIFPDRHTAQTAYQKLPSNASSSLRYMLTSARNAPAKITIEP